MFYELEEVREGDLEAADVSGTNACGMGEELTDCKAQWPSYNATAILWSNLKPFSTPYLLVLAVSKGTPLAP